MEKLKIEFGGKKKILAPMVRASSLAFRLVERDLGCDIAYGEEIVDRSIVKCERFENPVTHTIDFKQGNRVVYQTGDKDIPTIFQMGTADSVNALKAAEFISKDVDCIDLNMGCPKKFSVKGGMGAALLDKPDIVKDIVSTLKRNVDTQITCKIRLLPTTEQTVEFVKILEKCGCDAIAIHARNRNERRGDPARWAAVKEVVTTASLTVPVILNGDIIEYNQIEKALEESRCNSIMVARGSLNNPLIFVDSHENPELANTPSDEFMRLYLKKAVDTNLHYVNVKWMMGQLYGGKYLKKGNNIQSIQSLREFCTMFDIESYYDDFWAKVTENSKDFKVRERCNDLDNDHPNESEPDSKQRKICQDPDLL